MVIHGLLGTCLDQLALVFNCLKWCFVCGFEQVLKEMPCIGYPCNNSLLECFTKGVCLFEKMFQGFLKVCFESVVMCGLKNRQVFLFCKLTSTQELSTLKFSKIFAMF